MPVIQSEAGNASDGPFGAAAGGPAALNIIVFGVPMGRDVCEKLVADRSSEKVGRSNIFFARGDVCPNAATGRVKEESIMRPAQTEAGRAVPVRGCAAHGGESGVGGKLVEEGEV